MPKIALPLVQSTPPSSWHDWTAVNLLPSAVQAPEPDEPQGVYNPLAAEAPLNLAQVRGAGCQPAIESRQVGNLPHEAELLAPAGCIDSAYAAFHYGADAIYLGLKKFSARADAENFTLPEVDEITAYAHSLEPNRRVFVTVNTLIRQDELPELIEALAALEEIGVDAILVQDLGVYWAIRHFFPHLELHASTQLAVHNRAGAEILKKLRFSRVTLARELTFEEVGDITATSGIETEVFVHGALCYSYSGLCLFSAQTLGRSGNRGKCAYSCRDSFNVTGAPDSLRDGTAVRRDPSRGFPFSMKDLALPDHMPVLSEAGVSCFKIEGRKKSPLYVATTTDYYRKILDGTLETAKRQAMEADLQTVFSRPWTRLFVQSHKDKEVADRDTVGHRGTPIGKVEAIVGDHPARLRFRTKRALEQHDGLQIDLPTLRQPFGFAIEKLWIVDKKGTQLFSGNHARKELRPLFVAPAGALVEVPLPDDYPTLPLGAPVYCSSSQAVKQSYRFSRPKPGLYKVRKPLDLCVELSEDRLAVEATIPTRSASEEHASLALRVGMAGPFPLAQDADAMERAVHDAFGRLGATAFSLNRLTFRNPQKRFVPVSRLNQLRRELIAQLETRIDEMRSERIASLIDETCTPSPCLPVSLSPRLGFRWSIKVDRIGYLDAFTADDWRDVDEVVVDITRDHPGILREKLQYLSATLGLGRVRLSLPPLTRKWEERSLTQKIHNLRSAGWNRWEAGNLSAWSYLDLDPVHLGEVDLATDWSVYVINRLAALQLIEMGVKRFALSPEDGLDNVRSLLAEFGSRAVVIVHQDTPLFLAESCAYANLIGGCPGKANCKFESMEMVSSHGEKVTAIDFHCRTIVLNQGPFCLSTRLKDLAQAGAEHLRTDFVYRPYTPEEVCDRWRQVRAGQPIAGGHFAKFDQGIQ